MSKSQEKAYLREATYDKDANAIYVKVRDTKIVGTDSRDNGGGNDQYRC